MLIVRWLAERKQCFIEQMAHSCSAGWMQIRVDGFESLTAALCSPSGAHGVAANLDRLVALFVENIGAPTCILIGATTDICPIHIPAWQATNPISSAHQGSQLCHRPDGCV